jgi:hypothetical protein
MPGTPLRIASALLVASALTPLAISTAHAQRTSSLGWARLPGAEDCISTQALAERVERRLGRRVFVSASQADFALEGRVERADAGGAFVATLVVSDRAGRVLGRRVLRAPGPSCAPLEAPLVLVIAIAIDPGASLPLDRGSGQDLPEDARALLEQLDLPQLDEHQIAELAIPDPVRASAPPSTTPPVTNPDATAEACDAVPIEPFPALAVQLSARALLELGVLPAPAPGAVLAVTLAPAAFVPIELSLSGLLTQDRALADTQGAASMGFFAAGLALCPNFFA